MKLCRDERLVFKQTTTVVTKRQASINHYTDKGCLKKQEMKEDETYYLTAGSLS